MKKLLFLTLTLAFILSAVISVNAGSVGFIDEPSPYSVGYIEGSIEQGVYLSLPSTFENYMRTEIQKMEYTYGEITFRGITENRYYRDIYVSSYNIPKDAINLVMSEFMYKNADLFYVNWQARFSGGIITSIRAIYSDTKANMTEMVTDFNAEVNRVLALVPAGLTDFEKALLIHDYMVLDCEYDTTYNNYNAYNVLVEKTAVCQGYAYAYGYIMRKLGVECGYVTSDTLNHAWNIIKIDGKYYHVDVTWDDPVSDVYGKVNHRNFLFIDANPQGHNGYLTTSDGTWEAAPPATDTTYESAYWKSATRPFFRYNGYWYYILANGSAYTIYRDSTVLDTAGRSAFKTISADFWVDSPSGSTWVILPSIYFYYNYLFYNTGNKIMRYDMTTGTETAFATYSGNGCISQMVVSDGYVKYRTQIGDPAAYTRYTKAVTRSLQAILSGTSILLHPASAFSYGSETLTQAALTNVPKLYKSSDFKTLAGNDGDRLKLLKPDGVTQLAASDIVSTGTVIKYYDYDGTTLLDRRTVLTMGDVNSDGVVNGADAVFIANYILGKNTAEPSLVVKIAANSDGNASINVLDLILLLKSVA